MTQYRYQLERYRGSATPSPSFRGSDSDRGNLSLLDRDCHEPNGSRNDVDTDRDCHEPNGSRNDVIYKYQ